MSVQRSPPGTSSSLTDLSSSGNEFTVEPQVTTRKRKQPEQSCNCNCAKELQDFRKDITALLQKFTNTQESTMNTMRDNIAEMKSQLTDIKVSTDSLNNERISLKTQLSELTLKATTTDDKIQNLELEVTAIKNSAVVTVPVSQFDENIMYELQDRASREKNIIVVGLPEYQANDDQSRSCDTDEVTAIVKNLIPDCPKPFRIFRLGKYNPGKDRNVKVCFESSHTTKLLLRNKDKVRSGIKIYSDQTPAQQNYMKELKIELAQRIENGENNITIKYVKGTPKIVMKSTVDPKN